jgi:O-acetyl-ADP-ribose deacetylase
VIAVRVDDLAFYKGEAIIRPVNADLGATTPLLRRLELAAGEQLTAQLRTSEPLPVGAAVVTGAGALETPLMVHAVVSSREEPVSRDSVRRALLSALHRSEGWQIGQVAIPPFGLGAGNLDIEESADIMFDVLATHLRRARFPREVVVIAETEAEAAVLTYAQQRSGL